MRFRRVIGVLLLSALSGCGGQGVFHRVEPGQSAWRIAEAYGVSTRDLLEANGVAGPKLITPGQSLWIPGARGKRDVPSFGDFGERDSAVSRRTFVFPLEGKLSSGFGGRKGGRHDGVDILAPEGTEVRAASYGVVIYAGGGMRGYGIAVLVDHGEGVTTLYGHLKGFRVKSGDAVASGQVIGAVGRTGNATTSHLHFELRSEGEAVDPVKYLRKADRPG